jgi:hypothetical protein
MTSNLVEQLVALSFFHGPAEQANELIHHVRQEVEAAYGPAVSYEVLLTARSWEYVQQELAPRLALFLRSKKLSLTHCQTVFLSLFLERELYFMTVEAFYDFFRQAESLSEEQLSSLLGVWSQTGSVQSAALLPSTTGGSDA